MITIANAALPVAVGLVLLAVAARAVLAWTDDAEAHALARTYLEPLTTWCLIAIFAYGIARAIAGEVGVISLGVALVIGFCAVFLRDWSREEEPAMVVEEPPVPPAAAPPRSSGPLWARPAGRD